MQWWYSSWSIYKLSMITMQITYFQKHDLKVVGVAQSMHETKVSENKPSVNQSQYNIYSYIYIYILQFTSNKYVKYVQRYDIYNYLYLIHYICILYSASIQPLSPWPTSKTTTVRSPGFKESKCISRPQLRGCQGPSKTQQQRLAKLWGNSFGNPLLTP